MGKRSIAAKSCSVFTGGHEGIRFPENEIMISAVSRKQGRFEVFIQFHIEVD
jgi:hypothetical protein